MIEHGSNLSLANARCSLITLVDTAEYSNVHGYIIIKVIICPG